ncbi:MAG TPA: urea transporter, partial [Candidatus Ozemobacteraceae bacterium]|nr:urea transporter [Candidatus Ozemobacteraceae bacterium]
MSRAHEPLIRALQTVASWYSGILFSSRTVTGLLMMAAVTWNPDYGVASLLCACLMLFWAKLFDIPETEVHAGGYFANAILFGLYLGNTFAHLPLLLLFSFSGSFVVFILTRTLTQILWVRYGLPVCSYPFVLAVFLFTLLCRSEEVWFGTVFYRPWSYSGGRVDLFFHQPFLLSVVDKLWHSVLGFVFSVGAILYQKQFVPCLLATIALVLSSRISTLMAIAGYLCTRVLMLLFPFTCIGYETAFGFNAVLISIAIGSIYFVPGTKTTILMSSSQIMGFLIGLFAIGSTRITGGDWTALPFNVTVTAILLAMQGRKPSARPMKPGLAFESPEDAVVYYRRYEDRIFLRTVCLPVFGRWKIVQAFDGHETHREYWRYGVDFAAVDAAGSRFRTSGITVDDYFAFQAPVLSPVDGVVAAVEAGVDDNALGHMNLAQPWGNGVIIFSAGLYIGLYHLKKASILVVPGQVVGVGTPIGSVGNSGRSAVPHLHLQVQETPTLGAANLPFLLANVVLDESGRRCFKPFFRPDRIVSLEPMSGDDARRLPWLPRNGEIWHLELEEPHGKRMMTWTCSYTLYGNVVVTAADGE